MHLVWDWNGTLFDDLTLVVTSTNKSLELAGAGPVTVEEHRRDFCRPIPAYYALVLGYPLDDEQFATIDKAFHTAYNEGLASCSLANGTLDALAGWAGTQSLLSMWFHDDLVPTVERYGISSYFARVDGLRAQIGGGSKAPHLITHLKELGVDGRDCVLIGDSVDDAEAAATVGARVVLYTGGITDALQLRRTGRPVAESLAEAVRLAAQSG
jgi:phosphoglycolate phosphatase-like HAD superfamily hydrolase